MSTSTVMDWVFKVTTAMIIPILVWTFKMSNDVSVLKERVSSQEKMITELRSLQSSQKDASVQVAVNTATIDGVREKVSRISNTLDRIDNHLRSGGK